MSAMAHAQILASSGRQDEAAAFLEQAADAGDPEAQFMVANWRLFGVYGARDPARTHALLAKAAAGGSVEAGRLRAILIGNGTGCPRDSERAYDLMKDMATHDPEAATQVAMLDKMPPPEQAVDLPSEVLSDDPPIRIVRGLLTADECRYLMAHAEPGLQPSFVIDPQTGRRIPHPIRTSSGMNFDPTQEDLVIHAINRRIAAATGTDVECGELLHMLRYAPGEEYRPHLDALDGVANQRLWTMLVYLNDGYAGGETRFDELAIAAKGEAGDALIFRNADADGRSDQRTRHAGLPVTSGVKWLATRWIREAPYSPWEEARAH